ncbi:MAG: hypothetical protein K8E24_012435 [Methanobacterium paludis]|nr:hypothetical protein [Methanobacterium paludis]
MAPALSYLLVEGLDFVSNKLQFKIKNKNITFSFLSVILLIMISFSTVSYLNEMPRTDNAVQETITASNWLQNYDPDYKSKVIYADTFWPYYSWYLRMDVNPMPIFEDGKIYDYELKSYSLDAQDNAAFNQKLDENNVYYYFSIRRGLNLTGYKPIKEFKYTTLYEKIN